MSFLTSIESFISTCEDDAKAFWEKIQPAVSALESEVGQILLAAASQIVPVVEQVLIGATGADKLAAAGKLVLAVAEASGKKAGVDFLTSTVNAAIETAVAALPVKPTVAAIIDSAVEAVAGA